MGVRDWVNKYIVSIGPQTQSPEKGEIDLSKVSINAKDKVSDLSLEVEESNFKQMSGVDIPFDKIFEAAKITEPTHRFTVEKVGEMLKNPKLANLSRENVTAAVLVALDAQGVKVEEVIEEAVRKDLDDFARSRSRGRHYR